MNADLAPPLVIAFFTAAVATAAVLAWLTLSNFMAWRRLKRDRLALFATFTAHGALLATTVFAVFLPLEAETKVGVFRFMWVAGLLVTGTWLRAVPRFLDEESPGATRIAYLLYAVALVPAADLLAGALGKPFFLLPGGRGTSSLLMAATGDVYTHSPVAELTGLVLVILTLTGCVVLLRLLRRAERRDPVLVLGVLVTGAASLTEVALSVANSPYMAPLMFGAYIIEAARITFKAQQELTEQYTESRRAQATQRLVIAKQLDQLKQSQRLAHVGSATTQLSHDIRSPLAAADLSLELVEDMADSISEDRQAEMIELIAMTRSALETSLELVERITSQGRVQSTRAEVDLSEVLADALAMSRHRLRGVKVKSDVGRGMLILGDRVDLTQVFVNLLVNAADAIEPLSDRWVEIRGTEDPALVTVEVVDSGLTPGRAVRERMFDSGFTSRGDNGGTGLGLEICRRLVREHGGGISICADAKHTTMRVVLPAAHTLAANGKPRRPRRPRPDGPSDDGGSQRANGI